MIARAALLIGSALALTGCVTPWKGGTTSAVAPIAVADAQLVTTAPTEVVNVVPVAAGGQSGVVTAAPVQDITPSAEGAFAVVPGAVAEAKLLPSQPNGVSDVAAVAPVGTTTLVPVAAPMVRAVPERPAATGDATNPVNFALATTHPVGQAIYPRAGGAVDALACGSHAGPVPAQEAFLRAGGPQTDRLGLDPDGDGYACDWDPAPYRRAVNG